MTEAHVMEVRWSGDKVLGNALAEAAKLQGYEPAMSPAEDGVSLSVSVSDNDLQALRDRVDELLVAFSALEEEHNG